MGSPGRKAGGLVGNAKFQVGIGGAWAARGNTMETGVPLVVSFRFDPHLLTQLDNWSLYKNMCAGVL